jgi:hypothetical protein
VLLDLGSIMKDDAAVNRSDDNTGQWPRDLWPPFLSSVLPAPDPWEAAVAVT